MTPAAGPGPRGGRWNRPIWPHGGAPEAIPPPPEALLDGHYRLLGGPGIEPARQDMVFDLFTKLDPGSAGSGIDLAIVKRIIEVHGGRIWVESAGVGGGSTFCFTLPGPAAATGT